MDDGWIKIHRKMKCWQWYTDVPVKTLFIHLLISANHKAKMWRGIAVNRGQVLTGRKALSDETGLTEMQVRGAIVKLTNSGEINTKGTNRFTIITICNYEDYQSKKEDDNQPLNQQTTNKQPTNIQQTTTTKNVKNEKKEKNIKTSSFFLPEWVPSQEWKDYDEMRMAKDKKSWTQAAMKLNVKKLEKLVADGYDAREVLNQSVESGWKGLYPIKETVIHSQQSRYPISKQGAAHLAMEEIERRFREKADRQRELDRAGGDGGAEEAWGAGVTILPAGGEPEDYP